MSDESNVIKDGEQIDLSELKNFSFHASFDAPRSVKFSGGSGERKGGRRDGDSRFPRENSRQNFEHRGRADSGRSTFNRGQYGRTDGQSPQRKSRDFPPRGERNSFPRRRDSGELGAPRPRFEPTVDIEFYPDDAVFSAIVAALKATRKTYELFATAKLFLEKPERFAMVVKKKDSQAGKNLYLSNDDSFVFETEQEAIAHVLEVHLGKYFDIEEREVSPPAGNFVCLHRCGITGRILCPPNYHKYQEMLLNHQEKFLPNLPFKNFKEKIEKITDQQEIENWRASAGKVRIFIPKNRKDSENKVELQSEEEMRKYFLENFKAQALGEYNSVRISGETFAKMPRTSLSKSIFVTIEREKAFPLKFSNNFRGRLRRAGFTIYKIRGKSGISYISGIKRKFRTEGDVFADDIQKIISCIDANPKISIASLYLQCVSSPAGAAISADEKLPESAAKFRNEPADVANFLSEEVHSGDTEQQKFLRNLHWLIREGYIAEFENGTLISTEIMPAQKHGKKDGEKPMADDVASEMHELADETADLHVESEEAAAKSDDLVAEVGESIATNIFAGDELNESAAESVEIAEDPKMEDLAHKSGD
jgi:hypothetical protein